MTRTGKEVCVYLSNDGLELLEAYQGKNRSKALNAILRRYQYLLEVAGEAINRRQISDLLLQRVKRGYAASKQAAEGHTTELRIQDSEASGWYYAHQPATRLAILDLIERGEL